MFTEYIILYLQRRHIIFHTTIRQYNKVSNRTKKNILKHTENRDGIKKIIQTPVHKLLQGELPKSFFYRQPPPLPHHTCMYIALLLSAITLIIYPDTYKPRCPCPPISSSHPQLFIHGNLDFTHNIDMNTIIGKTNTNTGTICYLWSKNGFN